MSRVAHPERGRSGSKPTSFMQAVLWGLGALFVLVGVWAFFWGAAEAEDDSRRAEAALPTTPSELASLTPGTATLLAGKLAAREAVGPEGFVVYRKESYLRTEKSGASKDQTVWMTLSVPPPLIAVTSANAFVPICNRDYGMLRPPQRWQSDAVPTWRSVGDATVRLTGFKAGDALTADGIVRRASEGSAATCLETKAIFGGSPSEYLATLRGGARTARIVGGVLAAFGLLALILGRVLGRA